MKKYTESKRMQLLAGLITESEYKVTTELLGLTDLDKAATDKLDYTDEEMGEDELRELISIEEKNKETIKRIENKRNSLENDKKTQLKLNEKQKWNENRRGLYTKKIV